MPLDRCVMYGHAQPLALGPGTMLRDERFSLQTRPAARNRHAQSTVRTHPHDVAAGSAPVDEVQRQFRRSRSIRIAAERKLELHDDRITWRQRSTTNFQLPTSNSQTRARPHDSSVWE